MPIFDRSYRWFSRRLKDKYKQYSNIFLVLMFLGASLIWLLPMIKSLSETVLKYGAYLGFATWVGAAICAYLQYKVKQEDGRRRIQHERIVKDKKQQEIISG